MKKTTNILQIALNADKAQKSYLAKQLRKGIKIKTLINKYEN